MIFLIIYGVLALISFVLFLIFTEIAVKDQNSIFSVQVFKVNYWKIVLMALFFPLTWIAGIIHAIVYASKE